MAASMIINLSVEEKVLHATANINLGGEKVTTFSFALNIGFIVEEILCDGQAAQWDIVGEWQQLPFISVCQEVSVASSQPFDQLTVKYRGEIKTLDEDTTRKELRDQSYLNIIAEELIVLSYYSAWFPSKMPVDIEQDAVVIHGMQDYHILQARFDSMDNTWHYGGQGFRPYHIIAYRKDKLRTQGSPYITVYYNDDSVTERIAKVSDYYTDAMQFFNGGLFPKKEIPHCHFAYLAPAISVGGAYIVPGIIAASSLGENELSLIAMIAHEGAHNWCKGAPSTWEDWLNETAAEWSALIYALDRGNQELFNYMVATRIEGVAYKKFPPIRTPDGKRQNGVHERGTALLYEIYLKFGAEPIRVFLQTFVAMEKKNTEGLLALLRDALGDTIPSLIERGLTLHDYSNLC